MAQRAGETFDLVLRVADGALNGDDVRHIVRLREQLLQPLEFDLRGLETGVGVVVFLGDVLRRGGHIGDVAERADLLAEVLVLRGGHAHGEFTVAVAARAIAQTLALKVAAAGLHQLGDGGLARRVVLRLHLDARAVDHLRVARSGHAAGERPAVVAVPIAVLGVGRRELRLVVGEALVRFGVALVGHHVVAAGGAVARRRLTAAAREQGKEQQRAEKKGKRSFHLPSPRSFIWGL